LEALRAVIWITLLGALGGLRCIWWEIPEEERRFPFAFDFPKFCAFVFG
jgi:hypothetical protein